MWKEKKKNKKHSRKVAAITGKKTTSINSPK